MEFTGRCLCGAIEVVAAEPPQKIMHCHCSMCRRHSGAAFLTYAMFSSGSLRFSGQTPVTYRSSEVAVRSHCGRCGSPVSFVYDTDPGAIYLPLGLFDQAAAMLPSEHWQASDMLPWLHLDDGLPRYASLPAT